MANIGERGNLLAVEIVVAGRLADGIALIEERLEPLHGGNGFRPIEDAFGALVVAAIDQIAAEALDNGAETIGEPLAGAVVKLEVDGIFDLRQRL